MTDETTPKTDENPVPEPTPVEAHSPTAAEEALSSPPVTPETPAAESPAVEASVEPAEAAPLVAEATHADTPETEQVAEAAPESTPEPESTQPTEEPKPKAKKPRKKAAAAETDTDEEPATAATATAVAEPATESKKRWYAVKVQSGREESIKAAIERKVKIENLEQCFGQIVIPVEEVNEKKKVKVKVKDKKTGEVETTTQERNVVKKIKKFPGYIFAEVEFNDEILYVFRETSGVGDFVGIPARRGQGGERLAPAPMTDAEVQSMLTGVPVPGAKKGPGKTVVKLDFEKGDKVRIKGGAFAGHEAEVKAITEAKDPTDSPKVTVVVTMWGRGVDVTLDHWEVDKA